MKSLWVEKEINYDGSQLKSLFSYLNYELLGDSIVGFRGRCSVNFDHMVDGEDLLLESKIESDHMLHFIVEKFDIKLFSAVCLQRILSDLCISLIKKMTKLKDKAHNLQRFGDDIYLNDQKLNVSIATVSPSSTLIHYGINIENTGTPVKTISLKDFDISAEPFAKEFMLNFVEEVESIKKATQKVKWVK